MAKFKSASKTSAAKAPASTARKAAPRKRSAAAKTAAPAAAKKAAGSTMNELTQRGIMDSAQQIWNTGVKALGRAQQESTRLFEALVKEGANVEKKTRTLATGKVSSVRDSVENRVGQVKDRAADTWDRLEKVFEERVQRALVRLGVPGREELQALIQRVDQLNARLRNLADTPESGAAKPKAKAKPAATPAAEPKKPAAAASKKPVAAKRASAAKKAMPAKPVAAKKPVKKTPKKVTAPAPAPVPVDAAPVAPVAAVPVVENP